MQHGRIYLIKLTVKFSIQSVAFQLCKESLWNLDFSIVVRDLSRTLKNVPGSGAVFDRIYLIFRR